MLQKINFYLHFGNARQSRFNCQGGQYVLHCHIVEHEDSEMMRPYRIGPDQPGQPISTNHRGTNGSMGGIKIY
jgi:hypothetical protein